MIDPLITPGSTCKLGKGKNATIWEIQSLAPRSLTVYLSKLGGDGFVNKTANIESLLDVQAQMLPMPLYEVLEMRDKVRRRAAAVQDKARFITSSSEVRAQAELLFREALQLESANKAYWHGIKAYYTELVEK